MSLQAKTGAGPRATAAELDRGLDAQRARRDVERIARRSALVYLRWMRRRRPRLPRCEIARRLGLAPGTVAEWQRGWEERRLAIEPRGRPPQRASREHRLLVIAMFQLLGARAGLPTIRNLFPELSKGEILWLKRRFHHAFVRGKRRLVHALRWPVAGTVWAMDYTAPPRPVDGIFPWILVVRDLASGDILLALPVRSADASNTVLALVALFLWYGAPIVLKSDNGSHFKNEETRALLARHGVVHLLSPVRTPEYNGACEAGIGSLLTRAHHEAARHDRPGEWTCDDVEAARLQANETARPNGHRGPSPDESWAARPPLDPTLRSVFPLTCARLAAEELRQRNLPADGLDENVQASVHRVSIARALVEHGLLVYRRRRVSLRVNPRHSPRIS